MTQLEIAGRAVDVMFRADAAPSLAGGPAYVEAVISLLDGPSGGIVSSVARATGRSRDFLFSALDPVGAPLRDPYAEAIEIGGVETVLPLTQQAPVTQRVLVNQYLTLEQLRTVAQDGITSEFLLRCARVVKFDADQEAITAESVLTLRLLRDDAALERHYRRLAEAVRATPQFDATRELLVLELVTARSPLAVGALSALADHPDGAVSARVRQALTALG